MSLRWKISPLEQIVVVIADGVVTFDDIQRYDEAVGAARAASWQKIFVIADARSALSPDEIAALGGRLRGLRRAGALGAVAIVAGGSRSGFASCLRMLASVERPLRIFPSIHEARRWLQVQRHGRRQPRLVVNNVRASR